jgi:hypothetical protein
MSIKELEAQFSANNAPKWLCYIYNNENEFNKNDSSKSMAHILIKRKDGWEYFYFDERGGKSDTMFFINEEDACSYVWSKIEMDLNYMKFTKKI